MLELEYKTEVLVAHAIREYISRLPCKEGDKWIEFTAEQLREKVTNDFNIIFKDSFNEKEENPKHIIPFIMLAIINNKTISWDMIHRKLFT